MAQDTLVTLDPTIAQRNLAALREADPSLAERIEALSELRPTPIVSQTRDKRINFRLTQPDGSTTWFGRTSIPTIRASAILDRFDTGNANVLLPGIAEGTEAAWLLQRLGPHRAVFVWEPEIRHVALALRLHNVAVAIRQKRLVLLVCKPTELADALSVWLDHHPGHLCPNQMMMFPWQSLPDLAAIRMAVEQAYVKTEQNRQKALAEIRARWQRSPTAPVPTPGQKPRCLALVALHAQDEVWATADAIAQVAAEEGRSVIKVDIRSAGDMHPLARASRLVDTPDGPPTLAVLIDVVREQVADTLPPSIPAVAWLSHRAEPPRDSRTGVRCVTSPVLAARAIEMGCDARRIVVCSPFCLAPIGLFPAHTDRSLDVVLITDSPPIESSSIGPKLPSYAQLWRVASDLLAARIEDFTCDQAVVLLQKAEAKLQTTIEDASLREETLKNLGMKLGPSFVVRFIGQILKENGLSFRIHGPGWESIFPAQSGSQLTTIRHKTEVLQKAKVAVHADSTGLLISDALLAAGCGAAVLARRHPSDTQPGGLHTLLKPGTEIESFLHARELIPLLHRLLADEPYRVSLAAGAMRRCTADHGPLARLKVLETTATSVF